MGRESTLQARRNLPCGHVPGILPEIVPEIVPDVARSCCAIDLHCKPRPGGAARARARGPDLSEDTRPEPPEAGPEHPTQQARAR